HAYALGSAGSGLLQRVCDVDLSHDAVLHGDARLRSHRDRALARRCGPRVRFPDAIASHSKEQDFYFGEDFVLRRHDYHVDIAGGFPVAQYVGDVVSVDGMRFPTKRRAYMRAPDLKPVRDLLLVAIDFKNFRFNRSTSGG